MTDKKPRKPRAKKPKAAATPAPVVVTETPVVVETPVAAPGEEAPGAPALRVAVAEPVPAEEPPKRAATAPPTRAQTDRPVVVPTPAEAALEAARIVSQIVDIDSEQGEAIAAAAAAGAAMEAAVAAQKVGDMPLSAATSDPVTTVKLSRDRIVAALAEEAAAESVAPARMPRARTEPNLEGGPDDEQVDPVAIAAAAIARLRNRAKTDLGHLRVHYQRHDVFVVLLALVLIIVAGRIYAALVTPPNETFSAHGLTFKHSTAWLAPETIAEPSPRLVHDTTGSAPAKDSALYHVELTSTIDPSSRIEVLVDKRPAWSNIVTALDLDRRTRWGELYTLDDSSVRSIAGHDWLRTAYRYAHSDAGDVPRIDRAIEYATEDREQIYVLTLFASDGNELGRIEDVVAPSLGVQTQTGVPLIPQTGHLASRVFPPGVGRAFDSTVMVVVADLVDGRLKARGGGSGVIVGGDGSVLTNYHVIHDKDARLHDVFVIARFASADAAPELQCAGRPSRSKLQPEVDLALIKCDMDLDGRAWNPASAGGVWATLPEASTSDVKIGQRLWVLGYPDVGGGGLTLAQGEVEGWTGIDGASGKDFIKTDASITHGNSGGPVVDDLGRLVGIASAFRTRLTETGGVVETAQVGLVRPLQSASMILAYAAAGWTPREGHTEVELTPTAVEAATEGVRIYTTIVDDATETPIRDALVMVLHNGVTASSIDLNRLDDQAIAWGKTNAQGEVRLKQLVPVGTYTVLVIAPGYEQLIGEGELHIDDKTPPAFDPWGKIGLHSR